MRAVQGRGRRQDHVCVARRLVHVDVDADHQVDPLERASQPPGVRRAHDRIAGEREERAHLALAGSVDLVRHAGDRQLADRLGKTTDAAAPAPDLHAPARSRRAARVGGAGRGPREHRAARAVEIAGHDVEHVDEPARECAELLGAGADPPVDRGPLGSRELACHAPDLAALDPADLGCRLGREFASERLYLVEPVHVAGHVAEIDEALLDDHAQHAEHQMRVGAGPDEVVLVGDLGGTAAPRVDDHDLPPALADRPQAPPHVRRRQEAAVRSERVRPQEQQVSGPIDVGHRDRKRAAEHQAGGDVLGHLVDRRGGEDVARAHGLGEHPAVDQRVEVVRIRVAEVDADRIAAVLVEKRTETAIDLREGVIPRDLLEARAGADQRHADPVRILVQRLQRKALRADEPPAEHVIRVTPDPLQRVALERQLEPTAGLTQRARAIGGDGLGQGSPRAPSYASDRSSGNACRLCGSQLV